MNNIQLYTLNDNFIPKGLKGVAIKWAFANWEDSNDILNRPLYRGVSKLKQLAYLRKGYKGKNENGGRVCRMTTPAQYKNRPDPVCIPWGTLREDAPVYIPAPNKEA